MPQCKRNNCKEQAQPRGKRLCPAHEALRRELNACEDVANYLLEKN